MKRLAALCAALLLLAGVYPAAAERVSIPDVLRFTQKTMDREYIRDKQYILRTYPETANETVNTDQRALIDSMTERARPFLPEGKVDPISYLDVGSTVFRTGSQWMSFLTIAHIAFNKEQTYVDFDARVYDMVSGSRLTLTDLFDEGSAAWELMAQEVRSQLTDYFITESPDPAALESLCTREALENAAFTLTPAKLELLYRADALYPGKNILMHVKLYYSALRPLMNEKGQEITDNSRYKMIALTYDDGGARGTTNNLVRCLQKYGANATFFIVGTMMDNNHDIMCRQQDAGYAMASHNYVHTYTGINNESVSRWKKQFDTLMDAIVGVRPAYMRAPGGHSEAFTKAGVGLPVIHWSLISSDADSNNVDQIAGRVIYGARDGDVVLMHDLNPLSAEYSEMILKELENKNFLCVTVDELFDHYGVPLEPNQVYWSCADQAAEQ
ncbi:MAG: polysaccharide deacetylase family protein [Clostridia bacterium]|nr:polysaccharide deacetylase family protein [Clostridia bacterium]